VLAMTSVHSAFGNLGYTQMNFLPLLQLAALIGIWGISFCLMLFAATLAAVGSGYGSSCEKGVLAADVAIFLLAILGSGSGVCMRRKKLSGSPWDCWLLIWRRTYFPRSRRTRSA
jgi:apolipoprotein N-acyltransferase